MGLLRVRRERPCDYGPAEQRDELAAFHWALKPTLPVGMGFGRLL